MVRKLFQALSKEISSIHGTAYLLAFFALLAQLLALVRDRMLAASFGAGRTLDIYYAAFRIPDLIFVTIASLVSISILVPFFTYREEKGEDIKPLIDSVFSIFFAVIVATTIVMFFVMPYLLPKLFPGIVGKDANTLILLARILLLSPLFLGFSNFFASIVQMHNRFFLYAVSPILYNIGIIFGIFLLYPIWGLPGLVWGVILGTILHCGIQLPFIISKKSFPKLRIRIDFASVGKIVALSIPRTITLSTTSISAFALVSMASLIGVGSIAVFNFSFNLQTGPLSIIGVSYASAVFPILSKLFAQGKKEEFREKMISVTKHIIFWSMPATALFIVLRAQIVRTVLGAGQFSWSDTRLTAAAVAFFTLSMIPQSLILLFVRAFYSEGKTWKPLIINVFSMFLTIGLAEVLVYCYGTYPVFAYFVQSILHIENIPGSAVTMLAFAYTIGITINTALHWIAFEKEFPSYTKAIARMAWETFAAAVISGFIAYHSLAYFVVIFNINTLIGIFMQGLCSGIIGVVVGIIILKLMGSRELHEVWQALHKRFWKVEKDTVIDELV